MTAGATSRPLAWLIAIVVAGVAVDQLTKAWVVAVLAPGRVVALVGDLFQLQLFRNSGAAFSTGESFTIVFSVLAVVVMAGVFWLVVPKIRCRSWAVAVGLGLAGVAGNFVDRLVREPGPMRGHVIDFLALKYFAVFNVADMMLTAAAIMVVVLSVLVRIDFAGNRTGEAGDAGRDSS